MCGIVGLLIKNESLRSQLGVWMQPMLQQMSERGSDSAGLAVFSGQDSDDLFKISLYAQQGSDFDWSGWSVRLEEGLRISVSLQVKGNHAVLLTTLNPEIIRDYLRINVDDIHLLSIGRQMILYKDVGCPETVVNRYGLSTLKGSHLVGHTRMATESAVTPDHAHPFTAGTDFCLVHNGSLSNSYSIRRRLEAEGIQFTTDNDTEAACRFLEWRMREGDTLEEAIIKSFSALDGFFTFLMGTASKLALVRDPVACKPAVVAETDDYVAIASEYRALAHLPDIKHAQIFEPVPEEMYVWNT